jgi:hypothetical protein
VDDWEKRFERGKEGKCDVEISDEKVEAGVDFCKTEDDLATRGCEFIENMCKAAWKVGRKYVGADCQIQYCDAMCTMEPFSWCRLSAGTTALSPRTTALSAGTTALSAGTTALSAGAAALSASTTALSTGAIAGIAIACVIVVGGVAGGLVFFCTRFRPPANFLSDQILSSPSR